MRKFLLTVTALLFSVSLYTCASAATLMSDNMEELIQNDREQLELRLQAIDEEEALLNNEESNLTEEEKISKLEELEIERHKVINTIGAVGQELYLTEGFEALYTSTFKETKILSFDAPEGTTLQVVIVDDNDNMLYIGEPTTIGASRMFDVTLDLEGADDTIHEDDEQESFNNIICIFVRYDGNDYARQYEVNRKPESTKNELEAFDVFELIQPIEHSDDQGGQDEDNAQ